MSNSMQSQEKVDPAAPQAGDSQTQAASFGAALLGFMITTTLTTSLMVLLSQGG